LAGRRSSLSRAALAAIVIVIVVVAIGGGVGYYYVSTRPHVTTTTTTTTTSTTTSTVTPSYSLSPPAVSSYTTTAGTPITVTLTTFTPSPGSYALVYAGNGSIINTTQGFASLVYRYPGHYLVYYQVYRSGQLVGSSQGNLIEVLVAPPAFNESFAQLITVPVITLVNLSEPIVSVGQTVHLMAGFLQPPAGTNMTIKEYIWNLGNGTTLTIPSSQRDWLRAADMADGLRQRDLP